MEQCPQCGGPLKIIAAIEDPTVMAKILAHLGLSIRAPPRATFAVIRSTPKGLNKAPILDRGLACLTNSLAQRYFSR
jgi:hypothetical protein